MGSSTSVSSGVTSRVVAESVRDQNKGVVMNEETFEGIDEGADSTKPIEIVQKNKLPCTPGNSPRRGSVNDDDDDDLIPLDQLEPAKLSNLRDLDKLSPVDLSPFNRARHFDITFDPFRRNVLTLLGASNESITLD